MTLKESVAKAQLLLLQIQALGTGGSRNIEAEGWGKDPVWVNRGKDGKFGGGWSIAKRSKDVEIRESIVGTYNNMIVGMEDAIEKTQKLIDKLNSNAKKETLKIMSSIAIKNLHHSNSKVLSEISKEAGEAYTTIVKNVGNILSPKKIVSSIKDTIQWFTDHPERFYIGTSKVFASIVGTIATVACIGAVASASVVGVASLVSAIDPATAALATLVSTSVLTSVAPTAILNSWKKHCIETLEESFEASVSKKDKKRHTEEKKQLLELCKKLDKINSEIKISFLNLDRELKK